MSSATAVEVKVEHGTGTGGTRGHCHRCLRWYWEEREHEWRVLGWRKIRFKPKQIIKIGSPSWKGWIVAGPNWNSDKKSRPHLHLLFFLKKVISTLYSCGFENIWLTSVSKYSYSNTVTCLKINIFSPHTPITPFFI